MSGDSIKTLSVQVNVNASPLLNFFQTVGQQVNNLEKSLREANLPIEEISEKVGKMSLAAGHVSKEVADTIIHHGTSAQKAALITGRGLDELQGVAVKTAGTFLDLGKSIASAFKPSNMIAKLKTNLLGLAAPATDKRDVTYKIFTVLVRKRPKSLSRTKRTQRQWLSLTKT